MQCRSILAKFELQCPSNVTIVSVIAFASVAMDYSYTTTIVLCNDGGDYDDGDSDSQWWW